MAMTSNHMTAPSRGTMYRIFSPLFAIRARSWACIASPLLAMIMHSSPVARSSTSDPVLTLRMKGRTDINAPMARSSAFGSSLLAGSPSQDSMLGMMMLGDSYRPMPQPARAPANLGSNNSDQLSGAPLGSRARTLASS